MTVQEEFNEKPKAGCFAIAISFLLPLIGFIIYAMQRNNVDNPNAYLYAAFSGLIVKAIGAKSL